MQANYVPIDKESNITEKILQARFGSELWRYFLLVAIILALVEMTIARNAKKDLEGIKSVECHCEAASMTAIIQPCNKDCFIA